MPAKRSDERVRRSRLVQEHKQWTRKLVIKVWNEQAVVWIIQWEQFTPHVSMDHQLNVDRGGSEDGGRFPRAWKLRLCVFESWPKIDRQAHIARFDWSDHVSSRTRT